MIISKPVKIIIGVLTAWVVISPFLYIGMWFIFLFPAFTTETPSQPISDYLPIIFFPIFFVIICTTFLHIGLQAFYIVHVILNRTGSDVIRAVLGASLFILPILAMPVYYFIYMLPDNPPEWALSARPAPTMPNSMTTPPPTSN